jgi:trehalose 6-phosphate phosphatase
MTIAALHALLPKIDLRTSAVMLDVDGTLLDIAQVPGGVKLPQGLLEQIEQVQRKTDGAFAFLSGRTLANIDALFAPLVTPAVGCHGAEIRFPDGSILHDDPMPENVKARFKQLGEFDSRILVEDKIYSVALHYRLAPEFANLLEEASKERIAEFPELNLTVLSGHAVLEIKRPGTSKGTGLRALMTYAPFAGRTPYFAGDDRTDEDAIAALPHFHGIGISVGQKLAGATYEVHTPAEMRNWIAALAKDGA